MAARNKPAGKTQTERDRIALGMLEAYMDKRFAALLSCPICKAKMKPEDLEGIPPADATLMRARYDKLRPSLSAVEVTQNDPRDEMNADDMMGKLAAMFAEKPELWEQLVSIKQRAEKLIEAPSPTKH